MVRNTVICITTYQLTEMIFVSAKVRLLLFNADTIIDDQNQCSENQPDLLKLKLNRSS
ncbi:hypothetical protein SAMN04515674_10549 [Pseudarcicella hirudinis]|uniref:Uncharacterized protein n=1 Tax=Pseudarcicella hirudinis TaxID=1079859 RepID=A0A1I5SIZ2_9BACT|nr:hypothetical protein SAMN04515674_10549 [Pseudarcicella hirudinis]